MTLYLNDLGLLCALGRNKADIMPRLLAGDRSGFRLSDEFSPGRPFWLGYVAGELPPIPSGFKYYACRNNQLLLAAAQQIQPTIAALQERFGSQRIGVVLGTSTSGIRNTEQALSVHAASGQLPPGFHYKQHQIGAGADFLAAYLGVSGPVATVSAACASSGKAFATARRLLGLELCDAVIVGGADSLCGLTVNGFAALESMSSGLCKPFGQYRDGINIGEAAALFVVSRQPAAVCLSGIAASSDAYHFSAPDPEATAVIHAMRQALAEAGVQPDQVDYLNLHGTATPLNDAMESRAVQAVFGPNTAVSSTKGISGHTLGAASALELGFCWLLLNRDDTAGTLIPHINDDEIAGDLHRLNFVRPGQALGRPVTVCQSNSFAFGGSNVSIVLKRA